VNLERNTNRFFRKLDTSRMSGPSNSANFSPPLFVHTPAAPSFVAPKPTWQPNPAAVHTAPAKSDSLHPVSPSSNQSYWQRLLEFCQEKLGGKS